MRCSASPTTSAVDERTRETTIRAYLPLVRRMAKRIHRLVPSVDVGDLVGDGCVGLIRAVDGYDARRGTSMRHYVGRLVLGKMLNGIRRMDPVSERARRELRDAERERFELASQRGTLPTRAEMEERRPRLAAARMQVQTLVTLSLDRRLPDGMELPLDLSTDAAAVSARRMDREELAACIARLTERQRGVIALLYYGERTTREIGDAWQISPQRVSQLHAKALHHLRGAYAASR